MTRSIPPRLRAPVYMILGGGTIDALAVAAWGWGSLASLGPLTVAGAIGYYVLARRDSDFAAMLRDQADERQTYRRLKIQALVGRITTLAAVVAYLAAAVAKATLWPFAIFVAVPGVAFLLGWVVYRERNDGREQHAGH
jgi:L-alanine-DL-glutamate epimerase-like enolase superfamily enzyme